MSDNNVYVSEWAVTWQGPFVCLAESAAEAGAALAACPSLEQQQPVGNNGTTSKCIDSFEQGRFGVQVAVMRQRKQLVVSAGQGTSTQGICTLPRVRRPFGFHLHFCCQAQAMQIQSMCGVSHTHAQAA